MLKKTKKKIGIVILSNICLFMGGLQFLFQDKIILTFKLELQVLLAVLAFYTALVVIGGLHGQNIFKN